MTIKDIVTQNQTTAIVANEIFANNNTELKKLHDGEKEVCKRCSEKIGSLNDKYLEQIHTVEDKFIGKINQLKYNFTKGNKK